MLESIKIHDMLARILAPAGPEYQSHQGRRSGGGGTSKTQGIATFSEGGCGRLVTRAYTALHGRLPLFYRRQATDPQAEPLQYDS